MSEARDGLIRVVHSHQHAWRSEVEHSSSLLFPSLGSEDDLKLAGSDLHVSSSVLVPESVSPYDDRLRPARHEARNVLANDGFSKDSPVQNVSNSSIR